MDVRLAETITRDFTTHRFDTGAVTDADEAPTVEVFENSTDTTLAGITVTKRTGKTGNYRAVIVCTAANGYEAGKCYNAVASATVNGVAGKGVIGSWIVRSPVNLGLTALPSNPADAAGGLPISDAGGLDLDALAAAVLVLSGSGAYTITVTVTDGTDPIEGATVRFAQGVDSYVGKSDASGVILFGLDAGTYTIAATRAGYTFTPTTVDVTATAAVAVALTAVSIGAPASASQTRAYGTTRDAQGVAQAGVVYEFILLDPTTEGQHDRTVLTATSAADGQVVIDLLRLAEYEMTRTDGPYRPVKFTTTDTTTYQLPVI